MVNKYSLRRHLTGFFFLNKKLLLKSRRLTTIGLEVINIKIRQVKESSAFVLQIYL